MAKKKSIREGQLLMTLNSIREGQLLYFAMESTCLKQRMLKRLKPREVKASP